MVGRCGDGDDALNRRAGGGGERVTITQSGDPFGPSTLVVHSCQKQTGFGAHSFFVDKPSSGKAARFVGPRGVGTAGQAGEYVSIANQDVLLGSRASLISPKSVVRLVAAARA